MLGKKVGIDLGATLLRVHVKGDGIVLTEPSVVAVESGAPSDGPLPGAPPGERIVAVGAQAAAAAEQSPSVVVRAAVGEGRLADPLAAAALLQHAVTRACGRQRIFRPDVMVAVASSVGGSDRRILLDACARAGARSMYLIDRPIAAAIGAAVPVAGPAGRLVVDLGGGTVDAAVLAMEGIVVGRCEPLGGARLSAEIAAHVGRHHGVEVGMAAAEDIKREIASATPLAEERTLRVAARRDGEEVEITVSSAEVAEVLAPWLRRLDDTMASLIDQTPPRLRADLADRTGVLLTGGGALLRNLDRHLGAVLGMPVSVARDPALAVARGTAAALESLDVVRRTFLYVR